MADVFPPALITVEEAARRLGVSDGWIRAAIRERELEFVRVGGAVRFRPSVVDDYIDDHTEPTPE